MRMKKTSLSTRAVVLLLSLTVMFASACKPAECARMTECCAEIQGMDGVGNACGSLSESTRNPDTCRAVLDTVKFMLEDRKKPVPAMCKMP